LSVQDLPESSEPMTDSSPLVGLNLLNNPHYNREMAFTEEQRAKWGLRGLLPPSVLTLEEQVDRSLRNLECKETALERYIFLHALLDRNETLFYRLVVDHITKLMPVIYTPTVGEACQHFGEIFRRPRGLYIAANDRGGIAELLNRWPDRDIEVIVVTDGERILGLGDLGAQGMGIPIGKLSLYTACAGIDPAKCLPVTLDVGTNNVELRKQPFYPGLRRERLQGEEYNALVSEFVEAVQKSFPRALLQWEDFATDNAFRLLEQHRHQIRSFNDDIQGTASVTLAGILTAARATNTPLADQRLLFYGAGSAAVGIGELIVSAMVEEGLSESEARLRCWFFDSKGLVTAGREGLQAHKRPFAHDHASVSDLVEAIRLIKPTALLGVAAQPKAFGAEVIKTFAAQVDRPVVFALSNPTSKAECTGEEAYRWSDGRALFASGSPSDPVEWGGRSFVPSQANNVYIFPGLGQGVVSTQATKVISRMFLTAARTLSSLVTDSDLETGSLYPPLETIRETSLAIAVAVGRVAIEEGLATEATEEPLEELITARMYKPVYRTLPSD
jgi:malate dehydrogenase (oxaloacetate-decarboxylating)(NADP+)